MRPAPTAAQARGERLGDHQRVVEALELAGPGDQRQRPVVRDRELAHPHGHRLGHRSPPVAAGS